LTALLDEYRRTRELRLSDESPAVNLLQSVYCSRSTQVRSGTNISRSNPEAVQRNLDQRPAIWEPPATFEAARVVAIVVLEHPGSGCTPASPANDPENQLHRARALNDHWPFESNCVEKRCRGFHLSQPRSLYKHSRCHFLKWIELFFLHEGNSIAFGDFQDLGKPERDRGSTLEQSVAAKNR
jgi:hypothetical protein